MSFADIVAKLDGFAWGPYMLILLVGTGIFLSIRVGFIQFSRIGYWMRNTFGKIFKKQDAGKGEVTPLQAVTTALAATVGTGNIAGVTGAIVAGGPGAVFWMWISALFGMVTKYAEVLLSVKYRERNEKGDWVGGPMYYIKNGLGRNWRWLGAIFCIFGFLAAFGIGNMTQINTIASSVNTAIDAFGGNVESTSVYFDKDEGEGVIRAGEADFFYSFAVSADEITLEEGQELTLAQKEEARAVSVYSLELDEKAGEYAVTVKELKADGEAKPLAKGKAALSAGEASVDTAITSEEDVFVYTVAIPAGSALSFEEGQVFELAQGGDFRTVEVMAAGASDDGTSVVCKEAAGSADQLAAESVSVTTYWQKVPVSSIVIGVIVAIIVALVLIGGMKRIGQVTEKLVPVMAVIYILAALIVLIVNIRFLGKAFGMIFGNAFTVQAAYGGAVGIAFKTIVQKGVARGVFSNEAGLGSAPIAHAATSETNPVKQGVYGIFEVFMDTIVICTLTALVVLLGCCSGAISPDWGGAGGTALVSSSFGGVLGSRLGALIVAVGITLFALSTLLSWSLYGVRCFEYLFGVRASLFYKIVFVAAVVVGATLELSIVWDIADTLNGFMAIPNLVALLGLSGVVFKVTRDHFRNRDNLR